MQLTYRLRVKDKLAVRLLAQAAAGNFVWNCCNEVQKKAVESRRKWLNWNDLDKLTRGATKAGLDLHSQDRAANLQTLRHLAQAAPQAVAELAQDGPPVARLGAVQPAGYRSPRRRFGFPRRNERRVHAPSAAARR
jgi:hypothetical protein